MNVFIALTPYHLILTLTSVNLKEGDVVVLVDQYGRLGKYSVLSEFFSRFNVRFIYCSSIRDSLFNRWINLNNLAAGFGFGKYARLAADLDALGISQAFVFNDSCPEVQFLLSRINVSQVIYVEDGTAPYNEHRLKVGAKEAVLDLLIYGRYYDRKSRVGDSHYIKQALFAHPDFALPLAGEGSVGQLLIGEGAREKLFMLTSIVFGYKAIANSGKRGVLILLPALNLLKTDRRSYEAFNNKLSAFLDDGYAVYLKGHPLEARCANDFFSGKCEVVDPEVSSELFLASRSDISLVVGDYSTGLLSTRLFFPEIDVVSLAWCGGKHESNLLNLFVDIGVEVVIS